MGVALEREGNLEAAIAAYRRALENQPDLPETGYRLVDAVRRSGDSAEADRLHHGLLEINPLYVGDAFAQLSAQNAGEDMEAAIGWLNEAIAAGVSQPKLLGAACEAVGAELYRERRLDDAFPYLSRAVELDPSTVRAQLHLGDIYLTRFDNPNARRHYLQCQKHAPTWPDSYFPLAWTYLADLEFDRAQEALRQAGALGFRHPVSVALGQGWACHAQGGFEEAVAVYDALMKRHDPDTFLLTSYKALALHAAGRLDEAVSIHHAVAKTNPTSTDVQLNLALALCDAGQVEAAEAAYRSAAAVEPERAWTILTLAWMLARTGHLDAAREQCRKVASLPTNMVPLSLRLLPDGNARLGAMLAEAGIALGGA